MVSLFGVKPGESMPTPSIPLWVADHRAERLEAMHVTEQDSRSYSGQA